MCDMTQSFVRVTWLIRVCDVTDSYVWHDSFKSVKRLIQISDITPYVWHDAFIRVTWLIHICKKRKITCTKSDWPKDETGRTIFFSTYGDSTIGRLSRVREAGITAGGVVWLGVGSRPPLPSQSNLDGADGEIDIVPNADTSVPAAAATAAASASKKDFPRPPNISTPRTTGAQNTRLSVWRFITSIPPPSPPRSPAPRNPLGSGPKILVEVLAEILKNQLVTRLAVYNNCTVDFWRRNGLGSKTLVEVLAEILKSQLAVRLWGGYDW